MSETPTTTVFRAHPPHGTVVACERGTGRFTLELYAGPHRLVADEPREAGGDDQGPNPYEYLAAALASCTVMTLRLYADRKGWRVRRIEAAVTHRRIHARDCEDCESREGWVTLLERVIAIDGELTPEQRARLLEIAERCPVHRSLTGEIRIRTRPAGSTITG